MRSLRWTEHDPDDDRHGPAPQADGRLVPPSRQPPTAIGLATPQPPSEPYRPTRYGKGLTHVRRAAHAALGVVLIVVGGVMIALVPPSLGTLLGATSFGFGSFVGLRALRATDIYAANDNDRRRRRRMADRKGTPPAAST
jgi:hypothetical protein